MKYSVPNHRVRPILGAELGNYNETLGYLKKSIELKPDFSKAHQSMGNAYYNLGKYQEALYSYKKALDLQPAQRDKRDLLLMYATCELLTGNAKSAIAVIRNLFKDDSSYPPAMLLFAEAYLCSGEFKKGMQLVKRLERMRFDVKGSLVKFARMLANAGALKYALSMLQGALDKGMATDEAKALIEELRKKQ